MKALTGEALAEADTRVPFDPETRLTLRIDVVLTAVALYVPIRSCLLWVLPAWALALYVASSRIGTPGDRSPLGNLINLTMLCIFSYSGAYRQERQRRERWLAVRCVQQQETELIESSELSAALEDVGRFM